MPVIEIHETGHEPGGLPKGWIMTTAILEHDTETAKPAGDPAAELRELFALDISAVVTIQTCASPRTACTVKLICC